MIWKRLSNSDYLVPVHLAGFQAEHLYLTRSLSKQGTDEEHCPWLIGPYNALNRLATRLREEQALREEIADLKVRFGSRDSDVPPRQVALKSMPNTPVRPAKDHRPERSQSQAGESPNRETDRNAGAERYWSRMRLQAHHIVEDNIVEKLEADEGDLQRNNAPCVLLSAELHQRLFSASMTRLGQRGIFRDASTPAQDLRQLEELADYLYVRSAANRAPFLELRRLAQFINFEIAQRMAALDAACRPGLAQGRNRQPTMGRVPSGTEFGNGVSLSRLQGIASTSSCLATVSNRV